MTCVSGPVEEISAAAAAVANSSSWPITIELIRSRRTNLRRMSATGYEAREACLELFDRRDQLGQALFRVSEEHARLGIGVQLVVDARVARPHRALHDDDRARVIDIEDRHAV